jgi:hypothetical protein
VNEEALRDARIFDIPPMLDGRGPGWSRDVRTRSTDGFGFSRGGKGVAEARLDS